MQDEPGNNAPAPDAPNHANPLIERIEQIKNEIADVLLEIDNIKLQVNPQIEADYMAKIGCWENELLRAQIEARRMRRKCELAQAAVNRREQVSESLLEGILDQEFADWQEQLEARVNALRTALERRSATVPMSPESAKELKSLHRKLVKRLHPDLHPSLDEEARSFFAIAQRAYEHGDVETLRAVDVATSSFEQAEQPAGEQSDAELMLEIDLLEAQLNFNKKQLASLKASNPYVLGGKLESGEWVENAVASLKASIEEQREAARRYEARFRELAEKKEGEGNA